MLEMNRRMAALDLGFREALLDSSALDSRLAALLGDGFEEIDGCVVFSREADSLDPRAANALLFDDTGVEASVNHIHMEDELPDLGLSDQRRQAALFVGRLASELMSAYPAKGFVVIASIGDSTIARFHTSRPGPEWLTDDLEDYESEAVLRLRIGSGASG